MVLAFMLFAKAEACVYCEGCFHCAGGKPYYPSVECYFENNCCVDWGQCF